VVEKRSKNLEDILKTNNVTGDIRIPQNMECNIFWKIWNAIYFDFI